jgi:hypothetical protein
MRWCVAGCGGLAAMMLTVGLALAADGEAARTEAARGVVKAFATELTGRLKQAMETGGPTEAIAVCRTEAPMIAAAQSESSGWEVGRTSLRLRSPDNAPDAWEVAVLEEFAARKAQGQDVAKLERTEIVEADGTRTFRYMKAIPTGEMCTACHGTAIAPEVAASLAELYPEDQATGFAVGDLRGAFTLRQPM